jgi:hypothetical protein
MPKKVLFWDKPRRIMTEERRRDTFSSDSGVPGTYVPNMSDTDVKRWKAKLVGHKAGHPQVEIRKDQTVIVVSLGGGYKYKHYEPDKTKGINLHIASSGPLQWTWKDLENLGLAIEEAKEVLENL